MFAAILLAGMLDAEPLLPPVEPSDRWLFGHLTRTQTLHEWGFMCRHCVWACDRKQWRLDPTVPWDSWLDNANHCRQCWDTLDDVFIAFDDAGRIKHLTRLRNLIGWRNYYAGVMPLTQPFRELEAELTPPYVEPVTPPTTEDLDVPPRTID